MTSTTRSFRWSFFACLLLALGSDWHAPAPALSLPSGGQVGGGAATIQQPNAQTLNIQQHSDRALLNWQGFSIGQGETVQFVQPSATSLAVNRVLGGDPSLIFGQLLANGRVFLLNPNGVLFGPHATVNVGGLMATTLSLKSYDLTTGRFELAQDPTKAFASVINQGTLRVADHGFLVLAAPGVVNDGLIVAKFGQVGLAAGTQLAVDFRGDGLIQYAVEGKVLDQVTDPAGKPLASAVSNTGRIEADGGTVLLTGKASSAVVSSVINQTGVIQARRLESQGGEIVLRGGDEGAVMVAGSLNATGTGSGGTIDVRGQQVGLTKTARLDVSGDTGGGTITVGGGFQGKDGGQNAQHTIVWPGATLLADAGTSGDGGTVIVWADGATQFGGTISARGGSQGGNGGFSEVSGKDSLVFRGSVNLQAPAGEAGTLLLDPHNISIQPGGTTFTPPYTFATTPATDVTLLDTGAGSLSEALDNGNVTLQANTDIIFAVTPGGTAHVTVTATGRRLTLQAGRSIEMGAESSVTFASGGIFDATINDAGAIPANRDFGRATFAMNSGASIMTNGGLVSIEAGSFGGILTGEIRIGNGAGPATIDAGAGNISMIGYGRGELGSTGIVVSDGSHVQTTSGNILMIGTGAGSGGNRNGVQITGAGTEVKATTTGTIDITGFGSDGAFNNHGVVVDSGATVQTGSGHLDIDGAGGNSTSNGSTGVVVNGGTVTSATGPISITGSGGSGVSPGSDNNLGISVTGGGIVSSTGPAGAGPVVLIGQGGGASGDGNTNYGLLIDGPGSLVTTVSGGLFLTGTGGGGGGGLANYGLLLRNGAAVTSTGTGAITLVGHGRNGFEGITTDGPATNLIGGPSANGNITIRANSTPGSGSLDLSLVTIQGNKELHLEPVNAETDIGLAGGPGDFNLTTPELGNIVNGFSQIVIGRADGTGAVTFGPSSFSFSDNVMLLSSAPGGPGTIAVIGALSTTNPGDSIKLAAGRFVVVVNDNVTSFGGLTTVNGPIVMLGNPFGIATGNSAGIAVVGGTISSGAGPITMAGVGGDTGANNDGISLISNGAVPAIVQTTSGTIVLTGYGGHGSTTNDGIFMFGAGTLVTSNTGTIIMDGFGGGNPGVGGANNGIQISDGAKVTKTGAGNISIEGIGGEGQFGNEGVRIAGAGAQVTSSSAHIDITGTGGQNATGADNFGLDLDAGALVSSSGTGHITLVGTGGSGTDDNIGLSITAGATVTANTGALSLEGAGGAATGSGNHGLFISFGSLVNKSGAGTFRLTGFGGNGTSNNAGVHLDGGQVNTITANVAIAGTGGNGTGLSNRGVEMLGGSQVESTGSGAITITGIGGSGTSNNHGVAMGQIGTNVTSAGGDITITGIGGGDSTGSSNHGIVISAGAQVDGTGSADVTLIGTGGQGIATNTFTGETGVYIIGLNGTHVRTTHGDLNINGTGGGTSFAGYGVVIRFGAPVEAIGLGNVLIDGTGSPTGTSFNHGVAIVETGTIVRTAAGSVTIGIPAGLGTGAQGGGQFDHNYGVLIANGAHVEANGGVGSNIVISGVGGGSTTENFGVTLIGDTTQITTTGGDITINGQAAPGSSPGVFTFGGFLLPPSTANINANGGTVTINSNP